MDLQISTKMDGWRAQAAICCFLSMFTRADSLNHFVECESPKQLLTKSPYLADQEHLGSPQKSGAKDSTNRNLSRFWHRFTKTAFSPFFNARWTLAICFYLSNHILWRPWGQSATFDGVYWPTIRVQSMAISTANSAGLSTVICPHEVHTLRFKFATNLS